MAAFGYFQSYSNYFWQWEEDGQIVSITGGNTIAYRDYVLELLEGLSPQGMPPFGSLLLAIIATNEGRESLDGVISTLSSHPDLPAELNHAFDFLRLLSELPRTFRRGANRKLLFQTLFSKSHNSIGAQRAQNLISSHKAAYEGGARIHPIEGNLASVLRYDLRTLALLSKQYADTDSILKKMADLTLIEEEIRLEESEATEPSPDFIGELLQHYRSFHVAALVPHLWSALNLPFHHQLPSRQPLGGFSDLTNKGDLSRLLISEFANDDLLFLSRLANNEALYINREAPPQKDNLQRLLLLDVSLKSWGTPRTLAHALMLAIARHPKTDIACRAYAVGSSYTELFFSNLPQVIEGLQQLDGALHPAEGVERFFADGMAQGNCEVIFITSAETSKLPSVQRLLHNEGNRFQYVVYTDREGRIDLYKKQQNGRRHLQHLQLPLKQLWENRPKERTGKTTAQPPEPILHYPILFPGTITYQAMLNTEDGRVFQVNAEGVAFALASQKSPLTKGWDLLYEGLPQNNSQYEIGWQEDGSPLLFCFHHPSREASIVKLKTGEKKTIPFPQWGASGSPEFFFHEGQFHFLNHYHQYTFSWEKGLVSLAHQQKPYELTEAYKTRMQSRKNIIHPAMNRSAILKNINEVFLNEKGNLVFNIHELHINPYGIIKLEKTKHLEPLVKAEAFGERQFLFPNGSTVRVNRSGMVVLQSKANTQLWSLLLKNPGPSSLKLIQSLQGSLGLKHAKELVLSSPCVLKNGLQKEEASAFLESLRKEHPEAQFEIFTTQEEAIFVPTALESALGLATLMEFAGNPYYLPGGISAPAQIQTQQFWEKYIVPFTQNISKHGARIKAY